MLEIYMVLISILKVTKICYMAVMLTLKRVALYYLGISLKEI